MKTLIIASIVIALICPAVVMAAHKKSHKTSTPQTTSPNLNGKVVHGSHALRAKVSVRAHGSRHTMHPSVTSGGQFTMHLKPGTYTVWAKRRGAGKGHVAFHLDQGQTMNVTVPIFKHGHAHAHQLHRLGVVHRTVPQTPQTTVNKTAPQKNVITVPTVKTPTGTSGK